MNYSAKPFFAFPILSPRQRKEDIIEQVNRERASMSEICQQLSDSCQSMSSRASAAEAEVLTLRALLQDREEHIDVITAEENTWHDKYVTLATAHVDLTTLFVTCD